MNSDVARQRLYTILSELSGVSESEIKAEWPIFRQGLGLDSLSGVNLLTALDKEFGVGLDDIDIAFDALDTVGSLTALICSKATDDQIPSADQVAHIMESVAQASRLKEGRSGVERVLARIAAKPGLTSRELAADCALPTPTVSALRKEMAKAELIVEAGKGASLTQQGQHIAEAYIMPTHRSLRDSQAYLMESYSSIYRELEDRLSPVFEQRPSADTSIDQAKCLPGTAAARAILALEYGCFLGRKIAFIGDDDFTSVALGFLGGIISRSGKVPPLTLTVFDIDHRILDTVSQVSSRHKLGICTVKHDMRNPIPDEYRNIHDAFYTDPPYTVPGASLFLNRGLEACKGRGAFAFFSFASKGPEDMLAIHSAANELGLLVREVLPGFNRYEGASLWGNQSQMVIFEAVGSSESTREYTGPLYTADFRRPRS